MNRTIILSAAALATLSAGAQSFTVVNKNGESVGFNNENVERIEFSTSSLPEEPEPPVLTVLNFNDYLTEINPEEGILDLEKAPNGLGIINITLNGIFQLNEESVKDVTLSSTTETIFSRPANAEGMIITRDILGGTSGITYKFDVKGFTSPGIYNLFIPEGTYTDMKGNPLGATSRVYIIEEPAPLQTYTVDPTPGTIETLATMTLSYDNYKFVDTAVTAKVYAKKAGQSDIVATVVPTVAEDGTITINFDPAIKTAGTYSITIPAGTFALKSEENGKVYSNDEINLVYEIEGAAQLPPKVGDFYYSDGTWSSFLLDKGEVKPIGVIFYLGEANEFADYAKNYTVKDGSAPMSEFHGYVVALHDATYFDGEHNGVWWSKFNGNDPGCGGSSATTDFQGYNNTKLIRARADKENGGLSAANDNYPATYYATDFFESKYPAPAQSSGWFLPSAGQLQYIYDKVYFDPNTGTEIPTVEKSLQQLSEYGGMQMYDRDSEYWTSTEQYDSYGCSYRAYYVCYDSSNFRPGFTTNYNKNNEMRVRSVLAF